MNIREQLEEREFQFLSPYAAFSRNSLGRDKPDEPCDIRPCYQRDRDRVLHSKAFRRLKQKTQVFLDPVGDHYRTRLTHTLEVSQNARTIGKALRLNEDLIEAIALGHDLGHTPFGHAGERALNELCANGFEHNVQSVRVVEVIEKDGLGLNLTKEVRDGILNHRAAGKPMTLEGKIVRLSDKIAYLHHDIDDAIRGGVMVEDDIPSEIRNVLGESTKERLDALIHDIIMNSWDKQDILMSDEKREAMFRLRRFMFERVYTNPIAKSEEEKVDNMIRKLFQFYMAKPERMSEEYAARAEGGQRFLEQSVCDYISGMTDQYAVEKFEEIYIPRSWKY